MDDKIHENEHDTILNRICENFSLSIEEANTLISLATQEHKQTTDFSRLMRCLSVRIAYDPPIKF